MEMDDAGSGDDWYDEGDGDDVWWMKEMQYYGERDGGDGGGDGAQMCANDVDGWLMAMAGDDVLWFMMIMYDGDVWWCTMYVDDAFW